MITAEITVPPEPVPDRANAIAGRKFVWLLSPPWDNVWTRQNHFAIRLARLGAEILYVENPSAWSSVVKQKAWDNLPFRRGPRTREVFPGIHVMSPAAALPGSKQSDLLAQLNGRRVAGQIARWTRLRHWTDFSCWCRLPQSRFALQSLHPSRIIYDITDDYELYESNRRCRRLVRQREQQLLSRADLVLITAAELRTKETLRNHQTHWIPNGVEYDLFSQATQEGDLHPLVVGMRKPCIGYVGLTSHWMDFELLQQLGQRWPGHILMLGPIAAQVESRARQIPGITWGGFVPQPELPPYLRGIDLFIMPHLVNDLRKRANPLKIWEYLATGKPFVSVDLPALDPVRDLVDIAADHDQFLERVKHRLQQPLPDRARARAAQQFAQTRSWDAIFHQLLPLLQSPGQPRQTGWVRPEQRPH